MLLIIISIVFINIVFYYSSKRDAKYKEGLLFLVTLPDYALESVPVQQVISRYNKRLNLMFICSFILPVIFILLAKLLSPFLFLLFLIIVIFINIFILQIPFKEARNKLLEIKKENNWLVLSDKSYKVDLQLSSSMEKHSFGLQRYIIALLIDLFTTILMVKYDADITMYPYMFLQILVLLIGLLFITKQANQTFCDNSEANITINLLRKNTFYDCFFFLILCDSLFNLVIQLYLLEKLTFIYLFISILLSLISIIITLYKVHDYRNKKANILLHFKETNYTISDDDCWKIGIFGPVYYNPYDPRTLISMPGGSQLTFNTAKKSYRYFVGGIILTIILFLTWLFGYPYYLDLTNNLVDLSLQNNEIIISSQFYHHVIDTSNIEKIEISNDLGKGIRTNGSDTGIYAKGNYEFDKYGKCYVYLASLHDCYIVIYTSDKTYIINDDRIDDTKKFYNKLLEVIEHDN